MGDLKADKSDLMLLLLYAPDHTGTYAAPIRGITRVEKLMFLLNMEGSMTSVAERYEFEPYKFGPFSSEIYDVLEALRGWELVDVHHRKITDYYEAAEVERLDENLSDEEEDLPITEENERSAVQEKTITLTDRGKRLAKMLTDKLSAEDWQALTRIRQKYGALSLRHLIAYVYQTYPKYAIKSELV